MLRGKSGLIVFENTENTILVFSENCYCYLNLVFSVFFVFFITKKKKVTKRVFLIFLFSLFLRT